MIALGLLLTILFDRQNLIDVIDSESRDPKRSRLFSMFIRFYAVAFEIIQNLFVVPDSQIIRTGEILIVMAHLVVKNTCQLAIHAVPAEVPVDVVDGAVVKHNGVSKRITDIFAEDIQIIAQRLRMNLCLRKQRNAAVELAVELVGHGISDFIQHLRDFFKLVHND